MKTCIRCNNDTLKIKRNMCNTCYEFLRRNKLLQINIIPTPNILTNIQHEYLIGSLLGDGNISLGNGAKNPRLHISRKEEDIEYLNLEINIFKNLCKKDPLKFKKVFDKRTKKIYPQVYFRTSFTLFTYQSL